MYGSYGVTSDEVGLDVPSLVLQSVAIMMIVWLIALTFSFLAGLILPRAWLRTLVLLALGAWAGANEAGWWSSDVLYGIVGALVLSWALSGLVPSRIHSRDARQAADSAYSQAVATAPPPVRVPYVGVAVVLIVGLLFTTAVLMGNTRVNIDQGQPATPTIGPFQAVGFRAAVVEVFGLASSGLANGTCAHLLGRANGVTVLRSGGNVIRAPTDTTITRSSICTVPNG